MDSLKGKKGGGGLHPSLPKDPSENGSDGNDPRSPPLEEKDHKRTKKKMEPQPSTSKQAMKRKLNHEDDNSEDEVQPGPSKKTKISQTKGVEIKCEEEGCRHVARNSGGAVAHQALHDKGYLLRCTECDHLFAQRTVATKHVRAEHKSNEYHRYLVGPPGVELPVPNKEGLFECNDCPYQTRHLNQIEQHNYGHRQGFKFCCDICYSLFSTKESLPTHNSRKHPELKCDVCSEPDCKHVFRNPRSRTQHMKTHKAGWNYRCSLCHEIFGCKGRPGAVQHLLKFHINESPSIMEVKTGVAPIKVLPKKQETTTKDVRCSKCRFRTTSDPELKNHLRKHRDGFQFACNVCHQLFKTEKLCNKHMNNQHKKEAQFACREEGCEFKTINFRQYNYHKQAHTKGWVRQCGICSDVFADTRAAINHVHSRHPNSSLSILNNPSHIPNLKRDGGAIHHYKCQFCNSTFQSTQAVLNHLHKVHKKSKEELLGFKIEKEKTVSTLGEKSTCPYQQKSLVDHRPFKSKYCFYSSNYITDVGKHDKIFHEVQYQNKPPARLPKSKAQKANVGHLVKSCTIIGCTFKTPYNDWMRRHIYGHGAGFSFECNLCHNIFATCRDAHSHVTNSHSRELGTTAISRINTEKLLRHMLEARELHKKDEVIHVGQFRTVCMQTHMDGWRKKMLRRQLRDPLHSGINIKRVYKCPQCPLKTNTLREMKAHRRNGCFKKKFESKIAQGKRAGTEKEFGCPYTECKFQTDSAIAYYKHLPKHSIRIPVVCNICFDIFKTLRQCTQHSMAAHTTTAKGKRTALIFREPLEDLVCTLCKPQEEFYHSTCFLLHTKTDHPEIHEIECSRIMTTFDKDEFQDRKPPLPLREVDLDKKTSLLPGCMQKELKPLKFKVDIPCEYCDELFYHSTCVALHVKTDHKDKYVQ